MRLTADTTRYHHRHSAAPPFASVDGTTPLPARMPTDTAALCPSSLSWGLRFGAAGVRVPGPASLLGPDSTPAPGRRRSASAAGEGDTAMTDLDAEARSTLRWRTADHEVTTACLPGEHGQSTPHAADTAIPAQQSSVRLAFWGYTNDRGADAALLLARQFRNCHAALDGRAEIGRYFYATPEPVSDQLTWPVRDAGGPSRCDGGWDDLAVLLSTADQRVDAIVCESLDRVGRRPERRRARLDLLAEHDIAILCADEPLPDLSQLSVGISGQLLRRATTALHEYDVSWDALTRSGNRPASG
jgi:hypothetical protein